MLKIPFYTAYPISYRVFLLVVGYLFLHKLKMCKDTKHNLKNGISLAKANWTSHRAERIHEISRNPKDSWKAVNTLREWIYQIT